MSPCATWDESAKHPRIHVDPMEPESTVPTGSWMAQRMRMEQIAVRKSKMEEIVELAFFQDSSDCGC